MDATQTTDLGASVMRLFDKTAFSAARYPKLQAVFEKMVAASLESLREVCPLPPQYTFRDVGTEPFGGVLDVFKDSAIVAVFLVKEWDARIDREAYLEKAERDYANYKEALR